MNCDSPYIIKDIHNSNCGIIYGYPYIIQGDPEIISGYPQLYLWISSFVSVDVHNPNVDTHKYIGYMDIWMNAILDIHKYNWG